MRKFLVLVLLAAGVILSLERFRRAVGMAATRAWGGGKISTAKNGEKLWVWVRKGFEIPARGLSRRELEDLRRSVNKSK